MNEETLYLAARGKSNLSERAALLDAACRGDAALRSRIEARLVEPQSSGSEQQPEEIPVAASLPVSNGDSAPTISQEAAIAHAPRRVAEAPGTRIGPYKLLQQIGEGGMGVVYMAEQVEPVRRRVALKIIKPGMDTDQVVARFEAERQALAIMDHQNIAKVLDVGATESGRPYFVMELVHGVPITRYCDEQHLTPKERLELFIPVCHAIQHAHQKGIIHRDIKPSNILVTLYDGRPVPKVIDFGVAKAVDQRLTERTMFTQYGSIVGTLEYMSPEQAEMSALGVDTRSDIYSLGVLLYELLTGTTPLDSKRLREVAFTEMLRLIKEEEPQRPSTRLSSSGDSLPSIAAHRKVEPARLSRMVRGELDWIVMKALEKDRSRRYETADGLARDVERYLADEPVEACPPSAAYRLSKLARRYKKVLMVATAFAALLLAAVAVSVWQAIRESEAHAVAEEERIHAQEEQKIASKARDKEADARRLAQAAEKRAKQAQAKEAAARKQEAAARKSAEADRDAKLLALTRADGLRLSAEAAAARQTDPGLSLLLAIEGVRRVPNRLTYQSLYDSLQACREQKTLAADQGLLSARFFAEGRLFLTTSAAADSEGGIARVWDAKSGQRVASWQGYNLPIGSVDVSRDGRRAATALQDYCFVHYADGKQPAYQIFTDRVGYVWDPETGKDLIHLRGHTDRIVSIRFSASGEKIVTASWDGTARIWDAKTGNELQVLKGHQCSLLMAAFSPNGLQVLTLSSNGSQSSTYQFDVPAGEVASTVDPGVVDRAVRIRNRGNQAGGNWSFLGEESLIRIWDVETGNAVASLAKKRPGLLTFGHRWQPVTAAFSPDGNQVVAAFADKVAAVWDSQTSGGEKRTLQGHESSVLAAIFSPDGKWIATASEDQTVRIWNAATGAEQLCLRGHTAAVRSALFTKDSKRLLTASDDRTARVWDVVSGEALAVFTGHHTAVHTADFTSSEAEVLTAGDHTARLWKVAPPEEFALVLRGHEGPPSALEFHSESDRLLTAGPDGTARVWNLNTGKEALIIGQGKLLGDIRSAQFTSQGRRVLTASAYSSGSVSGRTVNRSAVHVWDAEKGDDLLWIAAHETGALVAKGSDDGSVALTVSDGYVRSKATGILGGDLSSGGSTQAGIVRLWSIPQGTLVCTLPRHVSGGSAWLSPDHTHVLAVFPSDKAAFLFDAASGTQVHAFGHAEGDVHFAAFSPSGEQVVTVGGGKRVRIWKTSGGQPLTTLSDFDAEPHFAAFSPNGKYLLTLAGTKAAVWEAATGKRLQLFAGHEGPIQAAAFDKAGQYILTGSADKTAVVWDIASGRMVSLYRGHSGPVHLVAFAPNGQRIATSSADGTSRVWPLNLWPLVLSRRPRALSESERFRYELPGRAE